MNAVRRIPEPLAWIAMSALATALLAVLGTRGWPTRTYLHFDFFPFWAAGRLVLEGRDPYDFATFRHAFIEAGSEGYAFGGPFAYPMPAALLVLPFAALPFVVAAPAWLVTQCVAVVLALRALACQAFVVDVRRDTLVLAALAFSLPGTLVSVFGGQVSGFLLAIVAGSVALLLSGRPIAGGAVLALGIAKPQVFLLAVPLILLRSPDRVRVMLGASATAAALVLFSFALRPDWLPAWLRAATAVATIDVAHANVWGMFPRGASWAGWVVLAGAVALVRWWWVRRRPPLLPFAGASVALSLAAAPYAWTFYDTVLALPAAAVLAAVPKPGSRRTVVLAGLALSLVVVPWLLYLENLRTGADPYGALPALALLILIVLIA